MAAWLVAYVIAGFGFARSEGEIFRFYAGLGYIPAAVIAFFMLRRHYRKLWQPDEDELTQTFE